MGLIHILSVSRVSNIWYSHISKRLVLVLNIFEDPIMLYECDFVFLCMSVCMDVCMTLRVQF
jgi:hypothetical protein